MNRFHPAKPQSVYNVPFSIHWKYGRLRPNSFQINFFNSLKRRMLSSMDYSEEDKERIRKIMFHPFKGRKCILNFEPMSMDKKHGLKA